MTYRKHTSNGQLPRKTSILSVAAYKKKKVLYFFSLLHSKCKPLHSAEPGEDVMERSVSAPQPITVYTPALYIHFGRGTGEEREGVSRWAA